MIEAVLNELANIGLPDDLVEVAGGRGIELDRDRIIRLLRGQEVGTRPYLDRVAQQVVERILAGPRGPQTTMPVVISPDAIAPGAVLRRLGQPHTFAVVTGRILRMDHAVEPFAVSAKLGRQGANVVGIHTDWLTDDGSVERLQIYDVTQGICRECPLTDPLRLAQPNQEAPWAYIVDLPVRDPSTGDDEPTQHVKVTERLRHGGLRVVNPAGVVAQDRVDDKAYLLGRRDPMRQHWRVIPGRGEPSAIVRDFVRTHRGERLVVKPRYGTTGAFGVQVIGPGDIQAAVTAVQQLRGLLPESKRDVIIERFWGGDITTMGGREFVIRSMVVPGSPDPVQSDYVLVAPAGEPVVSTDRGAVVFSKADFLAQLTRADGRPVTLTTERLAELDHDAAQAVAPLNRGAPLSEQLKLVAVDRRLWLDEQGVVQQTILEANARGGGLMAAEPHAVGPAFWQALGIPQAAGMEERTGMETAPLTLEAFQRQEALLNARGLAAFRQLGARHVGLVVPVYEESARFARGAFDAKLEQLETVFRNAPRMSVDLAFMFDGVLKDRATDQALREQMARALEARGFIGDGVDYRSSDGRLTVTLRALDEAERWEEMRSSPWLEKLVQRIVPSSSQKGGAIAAGVALLHARGAQATGWIDYDDAKRVEQLGRGFEMVSGPNQGVWLAMLARMHFNGTTWESGIVYGLPEHSMNEPTRLYPRLRAKFPMVAWEDPQSGVGVLDAAAVPVVLDNLDEFGLGVHTALVLAAVTAGDGQVHPERVGYWDGSEGDQHSQLSTVAARGTWDAGDHLAQMVERLAARYPSAARHAGLEETPLPTLRQWQQVLTEPQTSGFMETLRARYGDDEEILTDRLRAYQALIQSAVAADYNLTRPVVVVASPGRNRLFAGHTDSPGLGGPTVNTATQEEILTVLQATDDGFVHLTNIETTEAGELKYPVVEPFLLGDLVQKGASFIGLEPQEIFPRNQWDSYIRSAITYLFSGYFAQQHPEASATVRARLTGGVRVVVGSVGRLALRATGGVSSSSALAEAVALGLDRLFHLELTLSQMASVNLNEYLVGKAAGAADATAALNAERGKITAVGSFPEVPLETTEFPREGLTVMMAASPYPRWTEQAGETFLQKAHGRTFAEVMTRWAKEKMATFGSRMYRAGLGAIREGLRDPIRMQAVGLPLGEAEFVKQALQESEPYFHEGLLRELTARGALARMVPDDQARHALIYRLLKLIKDAEIRKATLYGLAEVERTWEYLKTIEDAVRAEEGGDRMALQAAVTRILQLVARAHDGDRAYEQWGGDQGEPVPTEWALDSEMVGMPHNVSDAALDGWIEQGVSLADLPGSFERSIAEIDEVVLAARERFGGKVQMRIAAAGMGGEVIVYIDTLDDPGRVQEFREWLTSEEFAVGNQAWQIREIRPGAPAQVISLPAAAAGLEGSIQQQHELERSPSKIAA